MKDSKDLQIVPLDDLLLFQRKNQQQEYPYNVLKDYALVIKAVHLVQVTFFAVELHGPQHKADFEIFEGVV
jgi:hypothetical protein